MPDTTGAALPTIAFFNINGNGTGHLSTCLAYANRLRGRARPVFFSLASAIEVINAMNFEADYFVSRFWSPASSWVWDRQLAMRLGMFLEHVQPSVIVFDGNWPYRGLRAAASIFGQAHLVWSNLTLFKKASRPVPVRESEFDLVIRLGEIGTRFVVERESPHRVIRIPPVTILKDEEILGRNEARTHLNLAQNRKYVLFSLGPGNLKDVTEIGRGLLDLFRERDISVVWARGPISARDDIPYEGVTTVSKYPLSRYLRAFDMFVGAAGYNSASEVLQANVPSLLVPNEEVADDQVRRAAMVSDVTGAIVSTCETPEERIHAVDRLVELNRSGSRGHRPRPDLDGAEHAAEEILSLVRTGS